MKEKELHTFGWYAARIAPHLPKEVFKPVPSRLIGGFIHLLVIIAGIITIGVVDFNPLFYLPISIIVGSSIASMGFLGHEILHGTVVRKSWLRELLGGIAFFPLTTGPKLWVKWHNIEHHGHTQHIDDDPDAWLSFDEFEKRKSIRLMYKLPFGVRAFVSFISLTFQFTMHSTRMFKLYINEFKAEKKPIVWMQFILPWVTWIGLLFWIGPVKWIFAFLIPVLIANFIVMAYISTNHRLNPLVDVNDPLANSLTVTVPKWVDVLHFNFSYHAEHHLFPGMNPKHYPLVKAHIKKVWPERYHEMPMGAALKALYKTPRIYYKKDDLINPDEGHLYPSLGNGLDPNNIQYRELENEETDTQDKKAKWSESAKEVMNVKQVKKL